MMHDRREIGGAVGPGAGSAEQDRREGKESKTHAYSSREGLRDPTAQHPIPKTGIAPTWEWSCPRGNIAVQAPHPARLQPQHKED
ncbi:hypothetical protein GCM10007874_43460 [Labrys miyagiensis]|uniref:Uncharacterized protein n=1 Tax=Labrys miyagiensis TaxID=346912 RepID=A0ABQ6CRJ4_9HYPH|nr:hypothetical protein GCM10007874_43460 [Labrys miyagiensis]